MTISLPCQVAVGSTWVAFAKLSKDQLTGFVQQHAFDALMRGTPFATIISDCVKYSLWWEEKQK